MWSKLRALLKRAHDAVFGADHAGWAEESPTAVVVAIPDDPTLAEPADHGFLFDPLSVLTRLPELDPHTPMFDDTWKALEPSSVDIDAEWAAWDSALV
jgi:hypothetical protein